MQRFIGQEHDLVSLSTVAVASDEIKAANLMNAHQIGENAYQLFQEENSSSKGKEYITLLSKSVIIF